MAALAVPHGPACPACKERAEAVIACALQYGASQDDAAVDHLARQFHYLHRIEEHRSN